VRAVTVRTDRPGVPVRPSQPARLAWCHLRDFALNRRGATLCGPVRAAVRLGTVSRETPKQR
jgi:hypothetical protein